MDSSGEYQESIGLAFVRCFKSRPHVWSNYEFYSEAGAWAPDPVVARVWGTTFVDQSVADIRLCCDPGYNYFFVRVATAYRKRTIMDRVSICPDPNAVKFEK